MTEVYLGDLPLWSDDIAKQMLDELCQQHNVPLDVFTDLVAIQRQYQDMTKVISNKEYPLKQRNDFFMNLYDNSSS